MNNSLDARFLSLLAEVTLKSLLLFGIAFAAARGLRHASAFARQSVWKAVMLSLLALPTLCMVLPAWRVPLPVAPILAPLPPPALAEILPPVPAIEPVAPTAPMPSESIAPVVAPEIMEETTPAPAMAEIPPPPSEAVPPLTYPVALSLYVCGVGVVLLRLLAAFVRLGLLARYSQHCTLPQVQYAAEQAARRFGLSRSVSIRIAAPHSQERIPMTWGYFRPCVLLPAESQDWDAAHLDAVLLHEFAHIARADWLMQQIAVLTCALYWFHPLVWKAARLLKLESERVCDASVVAAGIAPTEYASVLLATARAHKQRAFGYEGTISMANTTHLAIRIQSLLDRSTSRRKPSRRIVFSLSMVSLAGLLALAALRPADAAEPPAQTSQTSMIGIVAPADQPDFLPPIEPAQIAPPTEAKPVVPPSHAFKQDTDPKAAAIMKQVEAKLKSVRSLIADVQMTLTNERPNQSMSLGNGKMQQRGTIRLMKPNLYRLRYNEAQDNFVASDGSNEWIAQTESVSQQYAAGNGANHLPFPLNNFLDPCVDYAPYVGGLGSTKTVYRGQKTEQGKVFDVVEVQRGKPGPKYLYRLYIGKDKLIHRASLVWMQGQHYQQEVELSNIRVNPALSAAEFAFTPEETARYSAPRKPAPQLISAPPVVKINTMPQQDTPFGIQVSGGIRGRVTIKTTPQGEIAWGEVSDGLQMGLRNLAEKSAYTQDDYLGVMLVVRNVGKTARRLKVVFPSSISLNSIMRKYYSTGTEGELTWRGRDGGISRAEIVLKPNEIVSLKANIEKIPFDRWTSIDKPLTGDYTTRWDAPIEYRDADKPNSQRLKMPLPGVLQVKLFEDVGITPLADGSKVLYGKEIHGVQMGVSLPIQTNAPKITQGSVTFQPMGSWSGNHFLIASGQTFQTKVYLRNTTDKAVTVSTYITPSAENPPTEGQSGLTEITLQPLEDKFLYAPEIEFREGQREFRLTNADDAKTLSMIMTKNKNEYTLSCCSPFGLITAGSQPQSHRDG